MEKWWSQVTVGDGSPWRCLAVSAPRNDHPMIEVHVGMRKDLTAMNPIVTWEMKADAFEPAEVVRRVTVRFSELQVPWTSEDARAILSMLIEARRGAVRDWIISRARGFLGFFTTADAMEAWGIAEAEAVLDS